MSGNIRGPIVEMRPQQWVKNLLVFIGLIFSGSLIKPHDIILSMLGFCVFCLASSGVYLFNDLCDRAEDRLHPIKSKRPIASGELDLNIARAASALLFISAAAGAFALSRQFGAIIAFYILMCIAYSVRLRDVVILDVIIIATGFVLRAISGPALIGAEISEWLVICTSMVALLIGFGKRRHEVVLFEGTKEDHRRSLNDYSVVFLDSMMAICSGAAVVTYALYTRADSTILRVGSRGMLLSIPFVVYGIFRYLFLVHTRTEGGDPVKILLRDRPTTINIVLWVIVVIFVIYLPKTALFGAG